MTDKKYTFEKSGSMSVRDLVSNAYRSMYIRSTHVTLCHIPFNTEPVPLIPL